MESIGRSHRMESLEGVEYLNKVLERSSLSPTGAQEILDY